MWTTQVVRFGLHLVLILVFLGGSFLSPGHAKRERAVKSPVNRQLTISPKALRPAALAASKPGRKILLPWFDGKQLGAITKKRVQPRRGLVHLYGATEKKGRDPFTDVFLTIRGNTLIGTVFRGGKVFRLLPNGKGGHRLIQTESRPLSMGDDAISFDDRKLEPATVQKLSKGLKNQPQNSPKLRKKRSSSRRAKSSRSSGLVRKRGLEPQSDTPLQTEGESVPPIPSDTPFDEAHANLQDFSVEESDDTSALLPSHSPEELDAVGESEPIDQDDISPEIEGEPDTPISRGVPRRKARTNRSSTITPQASTPQLRPRKNPQPKRHATTGIHEKPQLKLIRDDGSRIDLLIVYTPEAEYRFRRLAGDSYGDHGFDMFIFLEQMVWTTNRILSESNVSTRLNIVGIEKIGSYQATDPELVADIHRLRDGVGPFNVVDALRVNKRADLVSAFLDIPRKINGIETRCGVGAWPRLVPFKYVNQGKGAYGRTYAFSLVDMYCEFQWGEVFAHEIGHNLGARHDFYVMESQVTKEKDPLEPNKPQHIAPFGFILEYTNPPVKTIMAYSDFCEKVLKKTCPTVHRYSSPLVHHEGLPLGRLGYSPSDGAYNAKVMYLYRETAANYLNSRGVPPDTPNVPPDAP